MKAWSITFVLAALAGSTALCAAQSQPESDSAIVPGKPPTSYIFVAGCCVRGMAPVTGRLTANHGDRIFLQTPEGAKVSLGGIGVSPDIARFFGTMKIGRTYQLPAALEAFEATLRGTPVDPLREHYLAAIHPGRILIKR